MPAVLRLALLALLALAAPAFAQSERVRGTIEAADAASITVKTANGPIKVNLAPNFSVGGVTKAALADVKPGAFIGVGAKPQPDGALRAIQIFIFPEAMRGTGEGHRPWAVLPETTMTNATVADTVTSVNGPLLTLKYKDGEQKVVVPDDAYFITAAPADKSELKAGAMVTLNATIGADGALTTTRVSIVKPGTTLPY
ncbi:MAG: hypothetical protein JNK46_20755 [Methylobacteriaceae bacterium]|nr:hypothetical protein [Methylobacteriaceae bacterium]